MKAIEGLDEIVEELKELDPTPEPQEIVEEVLAPVVIKTPEPQEIVEEPTIEPLKEPPTVYEVVSKDEISIPSVEQLEIVEEPITEASPVIDSVKPTVVPVEKKRIPVEQQVATHKNATPKRKTPAPLVTGETKTEQAAILPRYLPKKQGEIRSLGSRFHISAQKAMVVLVIGTALYFVALTLSALGSFDKLGGLSTGAVSSVLIIFGAIMTYPSLKRKISGEVFICPKCHESVEKNEKTCPSCGARFFPED
ncbi:MAG TPA: zinc-ribbon domain-containing protein [Methanomassiliicoccales archaeon]|nr:zinc-ribbon domain-containing protein [Methanomassiliicoccales archaeon]